MPMLAHGRALPKVMVILGSLPREDQERLVASAEAYVPLEGRFETPQPSGAPVVGVQDLAAWLRAQSS
ncbi:hypothetical protein D3C72_2192000 [compost metagenome]